MFLFTVDGVFLLTVFVCFVCCEVWRVALVAVPECFIVAGEDSLTVCVLISCCFVTGSFVLTDWDCSFIAYSEEELAEIKAQEEQKKKERLERQRIREKENMSSL